MEQVNSEAHYEREGRQSARQECVTKRWLAQTLPERTETDTQDASRVEFPCEFPNESATAAASSPVAASPEFTSENTALVSMRLELTKAACVLMAANSALGPHDAVGDVFQIYEEVLDFIRQRS